MLVSLATQPFPGFPRTKSCLRTFVKLKRVLSSVCLQLPSTMSGQTSGGEAGPPSRSNQRTFLDDVVLTFSSPMAWLLVVALVLTWSGVAIVLFDLLDYKTLAGLPPPPAIAKRGLRARAALRSLKPSPAGVHGDITPQESDDWLEMIWSFAASLVAPDEEEEGIHQLNETFTPFGSEEL
ncbi:triadin isoform X5 [Poecilia reticulata]|uniref:triadin isoform X5 n=1 Tax=Poecilia reticulata TaxID=8081 RepID=UPI0004A312C7|nr:PREDICTED: triadin isoform X5 [Poecilia reticulata]